VLPAIDVTGLELDEAYDLVLERMQAALSSLQRQRRLPVLG
jgi:hypothetical protein